MDDGLRIYRRSPFQEEAQQLCDDLVSGGVPARLRSNNDVVDVTFSGRPSVEYHVMVPQDQFSRADELLVRLAAIAEDEVPADHHLRAFTEAELLEVVERPDEWNAPDVEVARALLKERGVTVSGEQVKEHLRERVEQLARPEPTPWKWIVVGYALSFLFGLLGALIGWSLFAGRKTLPNGDRVPLYAEEVRFHGQVMFALGLCMMVIIVIGLLRHPP